MERRSEELVAAFAKTLREGRRARGLSQEELAFRAGLPVSYVSLPETCRRQPTLSVMAALAVELGLTLGELVGRMEDGVAAEGRPPGAAGS
jgi:transcriptional regulator with XRE-family HTH domain